MLHMSPEQYTTYWLYFDNIWSRIGEERVAKTLGTITNYYWCRLWRKELAKKQGVSEHIMGKTIRLPLSCGMKLKDVIDTTTGWHTISLNGDCTEHCHSLAVSDEIKRNSALKVIAGTEVANGYSFAAVTAAMRAPGGSRPAVERALHEAGGTYLTRDDVRNAGKQWSNENPDARYVSANFPVDVQLFEAKE